MDRIHARNAGKKNIYIHNDLANSAFHFRSVIEERVKNGDREGIAFDCMACNMMCAFAFEAYLNFFGQKLIAGWCERMKYHKKLKKVLDQLKLAPDETKRPYSSLKRVQKFRDLVAHGKPDEKVYDEEVEVEAEAEELKRQRILAGAWEAECTPEATLEMYEDSRSRLARAPQKLGHPGNRYPLAR